MLFTVSNEKIIVREDYLLIQALRNNKKVLYSKKIFLNEIEKIYFKDTFGISLILDLGIINYLINSRQKFIKIETDKKVYSYGLFIEYNDFLKIDLILQAKIKEFKDKEIMANEVKRKKEYENKKVLVGYNGSDEKEVTITKLKEDINEIRDNRSTFKK